MKLLRFIKYLFTKMIKSEWFGVAVIFSIMFGIPITIFWLLSKVVGEYWAFLIFIGMSFGVLIFLFLKEQWDDFNEGDR